MNKLNLSSVTLVCVSSVRINESISAIEYCSERCDFYDIKFITDQNITSTNKIKIQKCIPLRSLQQYSDFLLTELHNYIDSTHCLLIQDHAFISNTKLWNDNFLDYDYIGAPWPKYLIQQLLNNISIGLDLNNQSFDTIPVLDNYDVDNYRVGNGAFSLRSQKLLKFISQFKNKYNNKPEDNIISIYEKSILEKNNFRIAPIELAAQFAVEMPTEYNIYRDKSLTFGFHGI